MSKFKEGEISSFYAAGSALTTRHGLRAPLGRIRNSSSSSVIVIHDHNLASNPIQEVPSKSALKDKGISGIQRWLHTEEVLLIQL